MIKVIINADDFGTSQEVNKAITECFKNKWISSTTIMVNEPYFDEAVYLSKSNKFLESVGIHLNITKGTPVTDVMKKNASFCSDGQFINKKANIKDFIERFNNTNIKCLNEEIRGQIEKCNKVGIPISHIDSHHHKHIEPYMLRLVTKNSKKYSINKIRIANNLEKGNKIKWYYRKISNLLISKNSTKSVDYFGSFKNIFDNIEKIKGQGAIVEIMCHPTIVNGQIVDDDGILISDKLERLDKSLSNYQITSYNNL